jgi:hypothetical protein
VLRSSKKEAPSEKVGPRKRKYPSGIEKKPMKRPGILALKQAEDVKDKNMKFLHVHIQ